MLTILSLGGGVQSTTILLMAKHQEIEPIHYAVFADTGWEPKKVYQHLQYLQSVSHVPIITVQAGNIYEDIFYMRAPNTKETHQEFVKIPVYVKENDQISILRRQCTYAYKIAPIQKFIREKLEEHKQKVAKLMLGISLDEIHRMKDSRVNYIQHVYPLVEKRMRRSDCIHWLQTHNYPIPPKSSCLGCPFHTTEYFRQLKKESPEEFQQVVLVDNHIRHHPHIKGECFIHRSCKPIEIAIDTSQQELIFDECSGYCHT